MKLAQIRSRRMALRQAETAGTSIEYAMILALVVAVVILTVIALFGSTATVADSFTRNFPAEVAPPPHRANVGLIHRHGTANTRDRTPNG